MREKLHFGRVLLKLSGEVMTGSRGSPVDAEAAAGVAARVKEISDAGVQLALVIGAGNILRGSAASRDGMNRAWADYMGMLATVINALALREALEAHGVQACVQSAIPMAGIAPSFDLRQALCSLDSGCAVIFAAGTGHPYFTTDTTAALRACEIGADAILKATQVDGVYSADPREYPDAVRYSKISYAEALARRLRIMDSTAFSLCMDNDMPIVVFDFADSGALLRIVQGDLSPATLVTNADAG